jgi:hypothetical protein
MLHPHESHELHSASLPAGNAAWKSVLSDELNERIDQNKALLPESHRAYTDTYFLRTNQIQRPSSLIHSYVPARKDRYALEPRRPWQ